MVFARIKTLHTILKPRLVKWGGGAITALAAYDVISNQFPSLKLPRLGDVLLRWAGMSGSLLPWWGWLLVLQALFVYALFEYVRRNVPLQSSVTISQPDANVHLDLAHILHFVVDLATLMASDNLEKNAPTGSVPLNGDRDHIDDIKQEFGAFIRKTREISGGQTGDEPVFWNAIENADREADEELQRRLTESPNLASKLNMLREALQLEKRRDAAVKFLRYRINEKRASLASARDNLIDRKNLREKH